jgi:ribosomal protein L34
MPQQRGKGRVDPMMGAAFEGATENNEQDAQDRKTVMMVEKLFSRYKQARMPYDGNWVENYKFFRGKQWKVARPAYRNSEVLNFIYSAIQTIVPIMTDNRPNIEAVPENPEDFEFAMIMTQLLRSKWDRDQFSQIVAEAIVDACIYGAAISEQPWEQDTHEGLGDFDFRTVDPLHFYPDPRARDVNDNFGKGVITAIPTDLAEVKRKYPKKAHLLKADLSDIDMAKAAKQDMDDYRIRSATDNLTLVEGERPADVDQPDQILVITAWLKDDAIIEEKIQQSDKTGKKVSGYRTRKKYPNGRKIVVANKVLLEDEENPYLDGEFPFARLVDHILPREFWGEGEIDQLKGPQQILNKLMSYAMDVIELMGNPVWKNPTGSGVFSDSIVNRPGLVMDFNDGFEPRREQGQDVQPSIFAIFDRMRDVFERISGVNEVTRGVRPQNASGVAIENLQEAAQTRIRLKSRNVEAWLTQVGQQFASRILQFYSIPRVVRITDNPESAKYFEIAIDSDLDESGEVQARTATVRDFQQMQDPENGQVKLVPGETLQYEIKGNLDIRITTGTTLPFAKAQKKQQAKELFQLGIYDAEDLLTDMEHPRKDSVLNKLQGRRQAEAEAQAAVQQESQLQSGAPVPV